jgi:hypothetical protein
MRLARREKVFGHGRQIALDRNAKCRIQAYAKAWSRLHRQGRGLTTFRRTCGGCCNSSG